MKRIVIVGGGFAGLNAAKILGRSREVEVTLVDRRNHHLFQPLLYQVAMAALSPAEIAAPIRSLLSSYRNTRVVQAEATDVELAKSVLKTTVGDLPFDYLALACGATHSYFGQEQWEAYAPGLKTVEQATEIRRRVLTAYEIAERETNPEERHKQLSFVIVGGGPTGIELAGAIGEMSRFTLAKDFRTIDPKLTRIILVEAGPRILPGFDPKMASRATRDLEKLGVQVWTNCRVTNITEEGVEIGSENIHAATVLWAAGVKASPLGAQLGCTLDNQGRVIVEEDLSIPGHENVFVLGDLAHYSHGRDKPLPGMAPAAMQHGRYVAKQILAEIKGKPRQPFRFLDKGQMATIGRSRAVVETAGLKFGGWFAWVTWLIIHIYYLTGFKRRLFVTLNWAWSYISFNRGARLIVNKEWKTYTKSEEPS